MQPPDLRVDRYQDSANKVVDFCLGFFGALLAGAVSAALLLAAGRDAREAVSALIGIFTLIATVVAPVYLVKAGRRFIAFGVLSVFVAIYVLGPLVLLGACFLFLAGGMS